MYVYDALRVYRYTIKELGMNLSIIDKKRFLQLCELEEFSWMLMKMQSYMKKRVEFCHDKHIVPIVELYCSYMISMNFAIKKEFRLKLVKKLRY